jgi:hypothetical protein
VLKISAVPTRVLAVSAVVLSSAACGSDTATSPGTLTAALDAAALNVVQGTAGHITLNITRGGSFTAAVNITISDAPTGVSVSGNPTSIPSGSTSSIIEIDVPDNFAVGTYSIGIIARGNGVADQVLSLGLGVTAAPPVSYSLALTPTSLSVAPGAAAKTSAVTVTRTEAFTGAVGLALTGAPTGMTATVTPSSIASGSNSASISVAATNTMAAGVYKLILTGSGTGVTNKSVTLSVTVTASSTGVALALNPTSLALATGAAAKMSAVTISRTGGFTGAVGLELTGAPTGMTATVNPTSVAAGANSASISVVAANTVPTGTYNLMLTASGTGIPSVPVMLPVAVTGSESGSVTVAFCGYGGPTWVAAQNGTDPWRRVLSQSNTTYNISFPSGKGAVAVVTALGAGQGYGISVFYGTVDEFRATPAPARDCGGAVGTKTVLGTVAHLSRFEEVRVNLGGVGTMFRGGGSNDFVLHGVPDGDIDLIATHLHENFSDRFEVDKVILRRNLNLADFGTITPTLDFHASEAVTLESANLTVGELNFGEGLRITTTYFGRGGTVASVFNACCPGALPGHLLYKGIPGTLNSGEIEQLSVIANNNPYGGRTAGVYFNTVTARNVTLGPALTTPTVTDDATSPYDRPRVTLASQYQYNRLITAEYSEASGDAYRFVSVSASANYYGSAPTTWDLTFPDLSSAPGFQNDWALQTSHANNWSVSAYGGKVPFGDTPPIIGDLSYSAYQARNDTAQPLLQNSGSVGVSSGVAAAGDRTLPW